MLGRYRLDAVIGRGGMGVVFRAVDERLDRTVAIKVLAPELAGDPLVQERFLREARLAAAIEHPHIVPVFEAASDGDVDYIAMRLVPGPDLGRVLRREAPLDPARALVIIEQVADALDAAHARGLIHRDVKPSNVLLEDRAEEWAWLSDFGLTKRIGGSMPPTREGLVGTLEYIAPEAIERGALDGRSDQYALACVAYHCLSGRPPFVGTSEAQILHAHLHDLAPPIAGNDVGPSEVDAVIRRALAKQPADRFPSCRAFTAELRRAIDEVSSGGGAVEPAVEMKATEAPGDAAGTTRSGRPSPVLVRRGRRLLVAMVLAGTLGGAMYLVAQPGQGGRESALLPPRTPGRSDPVATSRSDPAGSMSTGAAATSVTASTPTTLTGEDGVIVFAGNRYGDFDIWATRPDGTGLARLTSSPDHERSPSVSADGSRIVYAVGVAPTRDIYLLDGNGTGRPQRLTRDTADDFAPAISPDGRHIAWVSTRSRSGHRHVWLMTDEGDGFVGRERSATDLTNERLTAGNHSQKPSWFPDGERIAFQSNDYDSPDIWSVDLEGNRTWWTRDLRRDFQPTVGPDDTIVFLHQPKAFGPFYLYRVTSAQGETRRVSRLRDPKDVDFSPDMRRLVVFWGDQLLTMSLSGTGQRLVTIADMPTAADPDWVGSVMVPATLD
jgi:serine/threonine-protein kinase